MPARRQRQHRPLGPQRSVGIVLHACFPELPGLLQVLQDPGVELGVLAAHLADGLAAARSETVFFHGCLEPGLIHIQFLLAGDVAGDLQRQPVGGIQVEGLASIQGCCLGLL